MKLHAAPRDVLVTVLLIATAVSAHHVITYPGTRGNNLITNETFPFGMQWSYPCGGLSPTTNRSFYPAAGSGGFAVQPGWFRGHAESLWYINLCVGANPQNCSLPLVSVFRIRGPNGDNPFPGTVCLQLQLPSGIKSGDKASIQAVQAHKSGAPAYSCADIEFTDDLSKVPSLNQENCFNSTDITVEHVRIVSDPQTPTSEPAASDRSTLFSQTPDPTASSTATPSVATGASEKRRQVSGILGLAAILADLYR